MLTGIHETPTCTSSFVFFTLCSNAKHSNYTFHFLAVVLKWNWERNNKIQQNCSFLYYKKWAERWFLRRGSGVRRVTASRVLATAAAPSAPQPGTQSAPARTQPGCRSKGPAAGGQGRNRAGAGCWPQSKEVTRGPPDLVQHFRL